ncbi:MAG: MBL fold metallo-hydrolase, partial [Anaerolineales bacterium]|nr:MBL fold metallo-hydrolase [Anaerolineales bacterium]
MDDIDRSSMQRVERIFSEVLRVSCRSSLFFRWLGVGGVQLRWGEEVLLIDPFLTRPSLRKVLFEPLVPNGELLQREVPHADAILITHAHYDHRMDTVEIIRQTKAVAYGSGNVIKLLRAQGIAGENLVFIQEGQRLEVGPFEIDVIKGKHIPIPFFSPTQLPQTIAAPRRVWRYQMDECFSFFIRNPRPSILIWHSTE